jgi:hypothetical protein
MAQSVSDTAVASAEIVSHNPSFVHEARLW